MAKTYKVLMLIENASMPFDNRVWAEATALRDRGFQVSVISPRGSEMDRESYSCIEDIHIYRYTLPTFANKYAAYILEYTIAISMTFLLSFKVLFQHGFDVLHAANPPDIFFLIGLFYRVFGKKFVFDQHDLSPEVFQAKYHGGMKLLHRLLLFIERCSYQTAEVVITTNASGRKHIEEALNWDCDKMYLLLAYKKLFPMGFKSLVSDGDNGAEQI
jgi:glycosyltransferase involved in cell wall biosynthesis